MSFAERLDGIRGKPHHVRRQVAFGIAGGVTAVIALAWLSLSLYTGAFAIKGSNFAELTGAEPATGADTGTGGGNDAVAGAAAAGTDSSGAPALDVVQSTGGGSDAQVPAQSSQNIIPF